MLPVVTTATGGGGGASATAGLSEEVPLGLSLRDGSTLKATHRVLVASATLTTFYTVWFIGELHLTSKWTDESGSKKSNMWRGMSNLFFELAFPACGYFGAMYANRQLTCCFCGCSLLISVTTMLFFFIGMFSQFGAMDESQEGEDHQKELLGALLDLFAFWYGKNLYACLYPDRTASSWLEPLVGQVVYVAGPRNHSPVAT